MAKRSRMDLKVLSITNAQLAAIASNVGGTYALIETIAVGAGGATSIVRTAEPDETPYSLVALMMDVHLVGTPQTSGDITIAPEGNSVALTPSVNSPYEMFDNTEWYFRCEWVQERGIWRFKFYDFVSTQSEPDALYEDIGAPVFVSACAAIDTVAITSIAGLPEGCEIKIYGVRV